MSNRDRTVLAALITQSVLAGANPVAIRFSNRELAPLWGATLRFALGAVFMIAIMAALKLSFPRGRALTGSLLFGLFQFAGAFGLYYTALVHMQAGFGQTILALIPLVTLLLALAQRQEQLRKTAVVGTVLALAGVAWISHDPQHGSIPWYSLLAALGSVVCFAEALVIARRFPTAHPVSMNAAGMLLAAFVLVGLAAIAKEPLVLPQRASTWIALGYISTFGSVGVFLLVIYITRHWIASRAAYANVLIPFVTFVLSAWLDREPITSSLLLGGLLVIAGVYVGALRSVRVSPIAAEGAEARPAD